MLMTVMGQRVIEHSLVMGTQVMLQFSLEQSMAFLQHLICGQESGDLMHSHQIPAHLQLLIESCMHRLGMPNLRDPVLTLHNTWVVKEREIETAAAVQVPVLDCLVGASDHEVMESHETAQKNRQKLEYDDKVLKLHEIAGVVELMIQPTQEKTTVEELSV